MILELQAVRHRFQNSAWELSLDRLVLESGELLGIIGPNGAGKSTLLRIAAGLLSPTQGIVRLEGHDLSRLNRKTAARSLGYLPQDLSWEYDLTVEALAGMGRYPYLNLLGTMGATDQSAVDRSLRLAGMESLKTRRLSQLSGGEKKRAFLASVLAQAPRALLLDEPTGALDLHHQVQIFSLLKNLARSGSAVAVVTHDINLASLYSDKLLFLRCGQSLAWGEPREVLTEEILHTAFGGVVLMDRHPEIDRPTLLPRFLGSKNE